MLVHLKFCFLFSGPHIILNVLFISLPIFCFLLSVDSSTICWFSILLSKIMLQREHIVKEPRHLTVHLILRPSLYFSIWIGVETHNSIIQPLTSCASAASSSWYFDYSCTSSKKRLVMTGVLRAEKLDSPISLSGCSGSISQTPVQFVLSWAKLYTCVPIVRF